jgi:hypothetical protein
VAPKDIQKYAFMEGFKLLLSESAEVQAPGWPGTPALADCWAHGQAAERA